MRRLTGFAAVLLLPVVQAQSRIDSSFQKFWAANSPAAAAQAADNVLKTGVSFDEGGRTRRKKRASSS
jgi:hypothetical protein